MTKRLILIGISGLFFGTAFAQLEEWSVTHSCEPLTEMIQDHLKENRENQHLLEKQRVARERNVEECKDILSSGEKTREDILRERDYSITRDYYNEVEIYDEWEDLDDISRCENYQESVRNVLIPPILPNTGGGGPAPSRFSNTNNQKQNIQEADILKSNGRHIFHVSGGEVSIYKAQGAGNIQDNVLVSRIPLTNKYSTLLLVDDTLVVAGMPTILLYDISNPQDPVLTRKISMRGASSYTHENFIREVDGKLYISGSYRIQTLDLLEQFDSKDDIIISPTDYLPVVDDLTLSYDKGNYSLQGISYPYKFNRTQFDCPQMLMSPGSRGYSYNLLFQIDLKNSIKEIDAVGYIGYPYFHMGSDNIYLVQSDWDSETGLISKIPYRTGTFGFQYHQEFDGYPIGLGSADMYSMDENDAGEFRLFTSKDNDEGTDLHIFDQTLQPLSSLQGIQPDEFFQGSLFLDDKAYLVTFRQTDPLFVLDLADSYDPKIIGELKIPGFSEYIHPYGPLAGGVQYLLGLGYDAEEERGRRTGLKLDLYKIDYNRISNGNILTQQVHSKIRESDNARSSILQNPRNFVRDLEDKILILPMEYLYNSSESNDPFNGIKVLSVSPGGGIQERISKNFLEYGYDRRTIGTISVGYVGDTAYGLSDGFSHFFNKKTGVEKHTPKITGGDVASDPEFIEALAWMYKSGLTKYNGAVTYRPNDWVTNEQSMKFIVQLNKALYPSRDYDPKVLEQPIRSGTMDYTLEPFAKIFLYDIGFNESFGDLWQHNLTREVMSNMLVKVLGLTKTYDYENGCYVLQREGLIKNCNNGLGISRYHMALLLYRAYLSELDEDTLQEIKRHQEWKKISPETY